MSKTPFTILDLNPEGIPDRWLGKLVDTKPSEIYLYNPRISSVSRFFLQIRCDYSTGRTNMVNYFTYRHTLDTSTRRCMDIVFCAHYLLDHVHKSVPAKFAERMRYHWLMNGKYRDEIMYWNGNYSKPTKANETFIRLYSEAYFHAYIELKDEDRLGYFFHSGPLDSR